MSAEDQHITPNHILIEAVERHQGRSTRITLTDVDVLLDEITSHPTYTEVNKATMALIDQTYTWGQTARSTFDRRLQRWLDDPTAPTAEPPPTSSEEEKRRRFGALRGILQQSESEAIWYALMEWIARHPDALYDEDVQVYTTEILSTWTQPINRLLTLEVMTIYLFNDQTPTWLLDCATGILLDEEYLELRTRNALIRWKHAKHIDMWSYGTDEDVADEIDEILFALGDRATWAHLKTLHIYGDYMGDEILEGLAQVNFPNLQELIIEGERDFSLVGQETFDEATYLPDSIKDMYLIADDEEWE